jgi:hypothetical protein
MTYTHSVSTDLAIQLHAFISMLAQESDLSPATIKKKLPANLEPYINKRAFSKRLLNQARHYRTRMQLGKFRAALMAGVGLLDMAFLQEIERDGLLLSDGMAPVKYGQFLTALAQEVARRNDDLGHQVHARLRTYFEYHRLALAVEKSATSAILSLRQPPRWVISRMLVLTNLTFLEHHFDFKLDSEMSDWLENFGEPETVGCITSLLLAKANSLQRLAYGEFAFPLNGIVLNDEVRNVMEYGCALFLLHETGKLVSLFQYCLATPNNSHSRLFVLSPPSPEFDYAMRLGFVRSKLGSFIPLDFQDRADVPKASMMVAAENFLTRSGEQLIEIQDAGTPFRSAHLHVQAASAFYNTILDHSFCEDALLQERLNQEFQIPLNREGDDDIAITPKLGLKTFWRIWRLFEFLSLVHITVLKMHRSDAALVCNSIVLGSREDDLFDLITGIGVKREEAQEFFRLVTADPQGLGFYDVQYHPFLRLDITSTARKAGETSAMLLYTPAVDYLSNKLRNVQRGSTQRGSPLRLGANPDIFVEEVARLLRPIGQVVTNRPLGEQTNVDVMLLQEKVLYLIECKYSLPAACPHELRGLWQDVEKGATQLQTALEVLKDREKLRDYFAGWFPAAKRHACKEVRIQPCILCSHFVFGGLDYCGIPVRDFPSFKILLGSGTIGLSVMDEKGNTVTHRYKSTPGDRVTAADFDEYLRPDARYFRIYKQFMTLYTEINNLPQSGITIAQENYLYDTPVDAWLAHLDSLGLMRLPDEARPSARQKLH